MVLDKFSFIRARCKRTQDGTCATALSLAHRSHPAHSDEPFTVGAAETRVFVSSRRNKFTAIVAPVLLGGESIEAVFSFKPEDLIVS